MTVSFGFLWLVSLLLSGVALFLSIWIVIPAPTLSLLPLGVGAPEVSPWLLVLNTIAAISALPGIRRTAWFRFPLSLALIGILVSSLPLLQFSATNQRFATAMQQALGANSLAKLPIDLQAKWRTQPLILRDVFRGIAVPSVRQTGAIQFAQPDGVPLKLIVYRPLPVGHYPTIVSIYGGAWRSGNPQQNAEFNRYIAAQGYTVVAIDYRHAPHYPFPAHLEDVRTALAFIRQHAQEYEIDVDRMALMGRSAGAHLAMLTAYQPDAPPLRAVVNYYGPVDLLQGYYDLPKPDPINSRKVLRAFLGGTPEQKPDLYQQASPIHYVTHPLPPTLLVYAGHDHLVQAKFGRALYQRLRSVNSLAVSLEIPWAEHAFDSVFNGISNQLALYYTERFLAWALKS
ncbi:MAG: alpha/beta hydrolase [Scytolyngbya sp. HA4215-MV1]|jgi:acetyl esterase/lipase|nr:alpha/beta hydrolase [Scytolyngbya sp. HA4215-MV1]